MEYYNTPVSRDQIVTASEVGDFVYCKRCWWMRLRGLLPPRFSPAMAEGALAHTQLERQVHRVFLWRRLAVVTMLSGLLVLLILLAMRLLF